MSRAFGALLAVALWGAASGCLDDDITGTRPLSFELSANPTTVATGETVTFSIVATGTGLAQVTLLYGDGELTERPYFGPVEIADIFVHAYSAPGTYEVVGELVGVDGTVSDTVTVIVN